ncbi:sunset domain-containing protein [Photobacterium sp. DNB22_13_2]
MGHDNPFVTGKAVWQVGHKNSGLGLKSTEVAKDSTDTDSGHLIRGNKNSKVYHLPEGCPSYNRVSPKNVVNFHSEQEALSAGYRKAGNCS